MFELDCCHHLSQQYICEILCSLDFVEEESSFHQQFSSQSEIIRLYVLYVYDNLSSLLSE